MSSLSKREAEFVLFDEDPGPGSEIEKFQISILMQQSDNKVKYVYNRLMMHITRLEEKCEELSKQCK